MAGPVRGGDERRGRAGASPEGGGSGPGNTVSSTSSALERESFYTDPIGPDVTVGSLSVPACGFRTGRLLARKAERNTPAAAGASSSDLHGQVRR